MNDQPPNFPKLGIYLIFITIILNIIFILTGVYFFLHDCWIIAIIIWILIAIIDIIVILAIKKLLEFRDLISRLIAGLPEQTCALFLLAFISAILTVFIVSIIIL
ncbi:MAG: hypothetical protein ACFFAK_08895 [Promethearchaeota archaeon]